MVDEERKPGLRYLMVADVLRKKIQDGEYRPGSRLPRQHQLAKDMNVAFTTLKQGLDILAREGYIVRKVGQGTYAALPHKRRSTALVVDDDENIRHFFAKALPYMGWDCTTVSSGADALEKVKEHSYDLVFLDLAMAGINGAETFREVRKIDPSAYVVIVTAYPESSLMQQALRIGPVAVMHKPLGLQELGQLLDMVSRFSSVVVGSGR